MNTKDLPSGKTLGFRYNLRVYLPLVVSKGNEGVSQGHRFSSMSLTTDLCRWPPLLDEGYFFLLVQPEGFLRWHQESVPVQKKAIKTLIKGLGYNLQIIACLVLNSLPHHCHQPCCAQLSEEQSLAQPVQVDFQTRF